jgi:hypothetical protein
VQPLCGPPEVQFVGEREEVAKISHVHTANDKGR